MLQVTLQPGSPGIRASKGQSGRVRDVAEGSQAEKAGLKVGWCIRKINGKDYSVSLLNECASGTEPYTLTVEMREDEVQIIELNDLTLSKKVGFGQTAEVFKGSFRGQVVAIKKILAHMNANRQKEFVREVTALAKINHENLVGLYGICCQQSFSIVTEFCEGGTLFDLLYNTDVNVMWQQKLKICVDAAKGMDYLHSFDPQIIHRDLKSLNLLLAKTIKSIRDVPVLKISDFGMAKMRDLDASWGKMTKGVGTLHWMAPELLLGCRYNERIDIYSYGMVLYEVICEAPPFENVQPASKIKQLVIKKERPLLTNVLPDCPQALVDLMTTCWAQEPSTRPSFRAILQDLKTINTTCSQSGYVSRSLARGPYQNIGL